MRRFAVSLVLLAALASGLPARFSQAEDSSGKSTNAAAKSASPEVQAIKKLRGSLKLDADNRVLEVNLSRSQTKDSDLAVLVKFPDLEKLQLAGAFITDAGLDSLQGLSKLKELVLENTEITDAGLAKLQGLKNLKSLNVRRSRT
jgi:hypothetical protein